MAKNNFDRRFVLLSASALAPALILSGCGGLGLGPTDANNTIYVLAPATQAILGGQPATWALAVDIPGALDSIDTRRIALTQSDLTMDYYADAVWPDRLPLLVQTALVAAFEASGRVPSVARTQDAMHADYQLGTDIRDCTAHYGQSQEGKPSGTPTVTVKLVCQVSTAHGRKILANFTASQNTDAGQNSTAAVVQAFNTALGAAVGQVVAWTLGLNLPLPPVSATP